LVSTSHRRAPSAGWWNAERVRLNMKAVRGLIQTATLFVSAGTLFLQSPKGVPMKIGCLPLFCTLCAPWKTQTRTEIYAIRSILLAQLHTTTHKDWSGCQHRCCGWGLTPEQAKWKTPVGNHPSPRLPIILVLEPAVLGKVKGDRSGQFQCGITRKPQQFEREVGRDCEAASPRSWTDGKGG